MKAISSSTQSNKMKNVVYWTVIVTTALFLVKIIQNFPPESENGINEQVSGIIIRTTSF